MPLVCRVCGMDFVAARFDAVTCSSTCRQRLRRGREFAYLAGLSKREQRAERAVHEAYDRLKAEHAREAAATRRLRDSKREQRRQAAEQERERLVAEFTGRAYLKAQQQQKRQRLADTVAGVLKLFAQERRNDMSAQAIADFINTAVALPISVEMVEEALAELHSSGDYDRIIAEGTSSCTRLD